MTGTVQELRRTRRVRRLGDLEWFEIAYRVYLAALVGGGAVLWASDQISDVPATAAQLADLNEHGPAILGLAVAAAVAVGLRSGSDGGPISLEAADVRHLLLAPVPRQTVLARPVAQRLRALAFGGAVIAAIAGVLAARRLPGSMEAWAASGAVFGAAVGAAFVAVAVLTHAARIPRWAATALAVAVLAAQAGSAAGWWPGPADTIGSFALWGMRQHPIDLVGIGVVALASLAAVAVAAAPRRRWSGSGSPSISSASTRSSRSPRRSTIPTTPTASPIRAGGCSSATSLLRRSRWSRSPRSAPPSW
jgi:hypothetical protein